MRCEKCHELGTTCDRCRAESLEERLRRYEEAQASLRSQIWEEFVSFKERILPAIKLLEERHRAAEKALSDVRDLGGLGTAAQIARRYFGG